MTENVSDRNGRALEYIVAIELEKLRGFNLTNQSKLLNERDKDKFLSLPSSLKTSYQDASLKISKWAESLFSANANVTVDRLNDNPDDPSDFILLSNNSKISISLKHNHEALKHPRPYSFAQACGYVKNSFEDKSHRNRMNLASNNFRNSSNGKQLFNQCNSSSIDKLYYDVCKACEDSLSNWNSSNKNLANALFNFLVSNGFYKVIVETRNGTQVKVQDYLNIPQTCSLTASVKGNRLLLVFNNGWTLNLRIHTASSRIASSPSQLSLKFDAQKEVGSVREFFIWNS
jgi:hypothetical protein